MSSESKVGALKARLSQWFARHPLIRDALLWAIPALLIGLVLRLILLSYSPYAYWGSDSRSYFGFTNGVMENFYFSLNEKRRYLYPILLLPVTLLPGSTLKAVAILQAGLGLLSILPFCYFIRRVFLGWKWYIIPLSVLYAGLPVYLWYEHELIAESLFFQCVAWSLAGWAAWVSQKNLLRARHLWWWFFVPFAIMVLTKPATKFLWPGLIIALVVVFAWQILRWKEWTALVLLFFAGLTVGDDDQGAWLLYTTSFPLTQVDTPKHAEYKAEIRDWVIEKRTLLDSYHFQDDEVHDFLREPEDQDSRPLWRDLAKKDNEGLEKLYHDLAFEGILAQPHLFLYIGMERLINSANPDDFDTNRFEATYFADRFADQLRRHRNPESMVQLAFGLPDDTPIPSEEQFRKWLAPKPDSDLARWMVNYADTYAAYGKILNLPPPEGSLFAARPTALGWWLGLGILASLIPPYLRKIGVWNIAFGGYLLAVYLVGIEHTRYFALVWPIFILSLAMLPDWILRLARRH